MKFSKESLDRFVAIYERKFNEPITREEAADMAQRLVILYQQLLRPLPPGVLDQEKGEHQAEEGSVPSS